MTTGSYDVIVIGYGVSGICLGSILNSNINTLVIENGKKHYDRRHDDAVESLIGCGGAGLFSDGKFSFYPSGTEVWNLNTKYLNKSWNNLLSDLGPYLDIKQMINHDHHGITIDDTCKLKLYPSYYLTLTERLNLINNIVNKCHAKVIYEHLVLEISKNNDYYNVIVQNNIDNTIKYFSTKYVIFAGGRFSSIYFPNFSRKFRRIEYGARIVAESNNLSMIQTGIVDPKYIFTTDEYQARTFCWCKNGEYILTDNSCGIRTYSGRSDIKSTNITNFGLNIRVLNPDDDGIKFLCSISPYCIEINDLTKVELCDKLQDIMGPKYGKYFYEALEKLLDILPHLRNNIKIVGPTIEGVGYYPDIDTTTLQLQGENMFACGDTSGIFRGIVPAMISGYYIGNKLNDLLHLI